MIAWIVFGVVALSFLSALGFYVFYGRKKIEGDTKVYDWTLGGCTACLCLACMALVVWQLSKGSKSNTNLGV